MRTDRFALADLGQQDRLDEIVTDAARGLEDTFDVNERSNTSTGKSTDGDLHDLALRWASENTSPSWGCKPEPPKFPSCQFHPFHKGIQVNHLAVTLKGIVSVQQNVSPGCRRYLGERRERLGVTCCFALR